jgi:hypothetical protein
MYVLNTLLPLLAIVGLGAFLRRIGLMSPPFVRDTNRLLYWVALPALLFYETAGAQIRGDAVLRVFLVLCGGMLAAILLGYALARALRAPRAALGAFVQGGYRSNLAYVGLPVILLALANTNGAVTTSYRAVAVIAIGMLMPIYNLAAVIILLTARPKDTQTRIGQEIRRILLAILSNPLVLSCTAGLLYALLPWDLPPVVHRTLSTVGQMSTPLALLGIGASLTLTTLRHNLRLASFATLIKIGLSPLAGYFLATWLGLAPVELRIALILLACPTAAASYVMAEQLGSDEKLAASIIVLSTLLSVVSLAISLVIQ